MKILPIWSQIFLYNCIFACMYLLLFRHNVKINCPRLQSGIRKSDSLQLACKPRMSQTMIIGNINLTRRRLIDFWITKPSFWANSDKNHLKKYFLLNSILVNNRITREWRLFGFIAFALYFSHLVNYCIYFLYKANNCSNKHVKNYCG